MSRFGLIKKSCNGVTGGSPEDVLSQAYRRFVHLNGRIVREDDFRKWLEDWHFRVIAENGHYVLRAV